MKQSAESSSCLEVVSLEGGGDALLSQTMCVVVGSVAQESESDSDAVSLVKDFSENEDEVSHLSSDSSNLRESIQ